MKGTKTVDAGRKSTMTKTQKQCMDCKNNDAGFCRFYKHWCYMVNKDECKHKIEGKEPEKEKKKEDGELVFTTMSLLEENKFLEQRKKEQEEE